MTHERVLGPSRRGIRRFGLLAVLLVAPTWLGVQRASAATVSVCPHGCAYTQIAPAVAAANGGDRVSVAAGAYKGGFAIDKDLILQGAGAWRTTISGGGPVITVGTLAAPTEPTVAIRGVTISGGDTHSSFGESNIALGGGVWVPPAANQGTGATLTIDRSVIRNNTAAPTTSVDAGPEFPCSDTADCQFAVAGGGGIDSWGSVTLTRTVVAENQATGPVTSDADGGGIYSQQGTLIVDSSVIAGNRTIAGVPVGRFAEGAGIMFDTFFNPGACSAPALSCRFVIRNSVVSGNLSTLTSNLPSLAQGQVIGMSANAGGIHVGDSIPTTVKNASIIDNSATANNPTGEGSAIDAGMIVGDSALNVLDSHIDGNRTTTIEATSADVGPSGSALEIDGPGQLRNMTMVGNLATSISPHGDADTSGGLAVFNFTGDPALVTVRDSVVSANATDARSSTGSATVQGGGVLNNSLLLMRNVKVSDNFAQAQGPTGAAQGGGIWNGVEVSGPPVQLTLQDSSVVRNVLAASPHITPQGGGLFTTTPVTLTNTQIARNRPDQCVGCSPARPLSGAAVPMPARGVVADDRAGRARHARPLAGR
jgi:hypothetical protein